MLFVEFEDKHLSVSAGQLVVFVEFEDKHLSVYAGQLVVFF